MAQSQDDCDLETPQEVIFRMNRAKNSDKLQDIFTGNWEPHYPTEYMAIRGASMHLAWWTQYNFELALGVFKRSEFDDDWQEVFQREFRSAVEVHNGEMYDPEYYD